MDRTKTKIKWWGRWVGTFVGFPLAGVTARAVAGNVDSVQSAALAGLAGGAVLGLVQAGIGGIPRAEWLRWIAATAAGLAVGLTVGASTIDYRTDTASLVVMGAISGAGVGLAQALSIPMRTLDRIVWAVATPILWAGGWLITSQVIVDADRQHAVFGSSGALAVSVVAGVLYALRARVSHGSDRVVSASSRSVVAS